MNMRIKKNNVEAATVVASESTEAKYADAIASIRSAIEALGSVAKSGDELAKESIANLSVILFDLQ